MRYFLSYVESGQHASLMLSTQETPNQPVKIAYEAGFDISGELQSPFSTQQGFYVQEEAASKAAYSSIPVKHRTYEVSEAEAAKFFNLINQHRTANKAEPLSDEEDQTMIKGPEFQLLKNNCKGYALNVLKEVGVLEAKSLSNSFFQITRTKNTKLKEINRADLTCPIKENFISEFNIFAQKINDLPSGQALSENPLIHNAFTHLKQNLETLKTKTHKIHIQEELYDEYRALFVMSQTTIDALLQDTPTIPQDLFNDLSEIKDHHAQNLLKLVTHIEELDQSNNLSFEWKTPPKVTKRINLDNFNEEEKAIYAVNFRGNQITDGLNDIDQMLKTALKSKKLNEAARNDLQNLATIIKTARKELHQSNEILGTHVEKNNTPATLKAYIKREKDLNSIVNRLNKAVTEFEPTNLKSDHAIIRFVQNIINLFRRESSILKSDPKKILTKKLNSLEPKPRHKNKLGFSMPNNDPNDETSLVSPPLIPVSPPSKNSLKK